MEYDYGGPPERVGPEPATYRSSPRQLPPRPQPGPFDAVDHGSGPRMTGLL